MAPTVSGIETRDILFASGDQATSRPMLAATLYLPAEAHACRVPALVVGHGAGSRRTRHEIFCAEAARQGLVVLALDFRGHGDSEGSADGPMEQDILAAVQVLREMRQVNPNAICYRGSSIAGFYGLVAAPEARFAAMVLICPAGEQVFLDTLDREEGPDRDANTHRDDEDGPHFPTPAPGEPPRWDTRALRSYFESQDSLDSASRVLCPVLIIHARNDDVVPFDHSLRLVRQLAGEATLVALPWGGHSTGQHDPDIHRQSLAWLKQILGRPPRSPAAPNVTGRTARI